MLKRDVQKFEEALEKLKAKMLLLGYMDYAEVCGEIATLIDKEVKEKKNKMKKYVSFDKRSKKAQKEYYSKQRFTWGVLNPVTRSVPSGKTYNREKDKQERRRIGRKFREGFDADLFILIIDIAERQRI